MSCSVYSLVPMNQLGSLMESLARAGIDPASVTVVFRRQSGRRPVQFASPDGLVPWYWGFAPAAWWWLLPLAPDEDPDGSAEQRAQDEVIVPYTLLEARRWRGRKS